MLDKVSVILPLFNCEKYITHAIRSVQSQTYKQWELIVVDDASTDNSLSVVKKIAKQDEHIKIIHLSENKGTGFCRNAGIAVATGRYLAFIDADDEWSRHKLFQQIAFMHKEKASLSHTAYGFMDESGKVLPHGRIEVDKNVDLPLYMKTTQIGMSSVIIDRKYVKDVAFSEEREVCEDAKLWMKYLRQGMKFKGINHTLLLNRIRNNQ